MKKLYEVPAAEIFVLKTQNVLGASDPYNDEGYLEWDFEGGN